MALNKTIDGFVYLENGSLGGAGIKYQAFFYPNGTASSPQKWNNVRTTLSDSYYNFNLGDLDMLGQDGTALNSSKVIVVFWKGGNRLDNCSLIEKWGAYELTVSVAATYTYQAQIKPNISPILVWSFPANGLVNTSYSSTNASYDVHNWPWMGNTMNHWYTRYGQTIFNINKVNNTDYFWGDTQQTLNLAGASTSSHMWTAAGDYTIRIVIEDECGATVTGTQAIRIRWRAPVPNLICHQAIGQNVVTPDTVVTFAYSGTDIDNRIIDIDWAIDDRADTIVGAVPKTSIVNHTNGTGTDWYGHPASSGAFTDHGGHPVLIVVHWNDGFDDLTINYSEVFNQLKFTGPDVDFDQDPDRAVVTSGVTFTNTSTDADRVGTGLPGGLKYDWTWNDDGTIDTESDVDIFYVLSKVANSDTCEVELCANWQDGWDNQITCITKNVVFETTVDVNKTECYYELAVYGTSSDGTKDGYSWEVYRSTVSGIEGPYELIWSSPIGMDQKLKTICFTQETFYRVVGFVHGNGATTSGEEYIYVYDICESECALILWNGTGLLDGGGDFIRTGHGDEESYAKYEGTNGLDATDFKNNKTIMFRDPDEANIDNYDLLSMWINVKEWQSGKHVEVYFNIGNKVNLDAYINTNLKNEWQRVLIPYSDLGLITPPINIFDLTLKSTGDIGFYLDNVELVVGTAVYKVVAIEKPSMTAEAQDTPITRASTVDYRPGMSAFPPPGNL